MASKKIVTCDICGTAWKAGGGFASHRRACERKALALQERAQQQMKLQSSLLSNGAIAASSPPPPPALQLTATFDGQLLLLKPLLLMPTHRVNKLRADGT